MLLELWAFELQAFLELFAFVAPCFCSYCIRPIDFRCFQRAGPVFKGLSHLCCCDQDEGSEACQGFRGLDIPPGLISVCVVCGRSVFFFMERLPDRIPNAGWGVAGLHGSVVGYAADSEGLRKVLWIPLDQLFLEWVSGCRDPMGFRGVPWGHWMFLRAAG